MTPLVGRFVYYGTADFGALRVGLSVRVETGGHKGFAGMSGRSSMDRVVRLAVVSGAALCWLAGGLQAQKAPRYQSPIMAPAGPAPTALPVPVAVTPNGTVVEDVIVRVNDQIITRSDVERSQQQLLQEDQQNHATPAEAEERQKNMLRDMIDQQLLLSRGKELGVNADAEVIRRLDDIRKQNKLDSMEALEKAARAQGISFEDFRANIRNNVITQQVVRDEVGRRLGQMTQAQEQTYYDAHKQEFEQPEQVRLAEILIPTPADATDAQVAQAQTKADGLAAKIKDGAKFEDVAKASSGGQTASQGGELGLFKRGALAKVLEDQTFSLDTGGVTAPIRTRQGFVILKVLDHVKAGVPPMKDIEQDLQQGIYQEAMQPALRAYLTKLREDSYVDIRPGYVDAGASPKQTKPIFSAYAPPPVKKKSKQQATRMGGFQRASVGANKGDSDGSVAAGTAVPALPPANAAASAASGVPSETGGEKSVASDAGAPASVPAAGASGLASSSSSSAALPVNNTGRIARATSVRQLKEKKIKREKVRFGQAPRNALPAGPVEIASNEAQTTPGNAAGGLPVAQAPANVEDPLAALPTAPTQKTRFSARAPQVKLRKTQAKNVKAREKVIATPVAMTQDEKVTQKTQAAPLGLNGDTTKKKKKRKKGDPKERLQEKAPEPKTDKYANPTGPGTVNDLSRTPVGGVATDAPAKAAPKSADQTTLPSAAAPAPGAPVAPAVPGSTVPPAGSTVPAGMPQ